MRSFFLSSYTKKKRITKNKKTLKKTPSLSGDNLFSAPKVSQSFSNSNLGHLWHSSDSDCLWVPETLQSTSHSKPFPTVPNTTACSLHSIPSNPNSAPTFLGDSSSCSGDKVAPMASNIKGRVIKVIRNIKGRGWSGLVGNARRWPWS